MPDSDSTPLIKIDRDRGVFQVTRRSFTDSAILERECEQVFGKVPFISIRPSGLRVGSRNRAASTILRLMSRTVQ